MATVQGFFFFQCGNSKVGVRLEEAGVCFPIFSASCTWDKGFLQVWVQVWWGKRASELLSTFTINLISSIYN